MQLDVKIHCTTVFIYKIAKNRLIRKNLMCYKRSNLSGKDKMVLRDTDRSFQKNKFHFYILRDNKIIYVVKQVNL